MNEDQFIPFLKEFFAKAGMQTNDIPRTNDQTPDFEVISKAEKYIVELKIKSDDTEETKRDIAVLESGEILSKSKALIKRNRLSGIIKKGCEQIFSHDPTHQHFHILWLHGDGPDGHAYYEQFVATLFGAQSMISSRTSRSTPLDNSV